jgi:hypothetical protein
MTTRTKRKCGIVTCENILSARSRLDECPQCRANFRYWLKRPAHVRVTRRRKLAKYSERMDVVIGNGVTIIRRKAS